MHPRAAIRQRVVARLAARPAVVRPAAGGVVWVEGSRAAPIQDKRLPAVLVQIEEDEFQSTDTTRDEERSLTLLLSLQATGNTGTEVQDYLDALAEAVEQCIHEDRQHGTLAHDTEYDGTAIELEDQGASVLGELEIRYRITYAREYAPLVLPDAETIEADFDIESETAGQIEAHSKVTLET